MALLWATSRTVQSSRLARAMLTSPKLGKAQCWLLGNATATLLTYRPASESLDNVKHQAALSVLTLTLAELSNAAARDFIEAHQQLEEEI